MHEDLEAASFRLTCMNFSYVKEFAFVRNTSESEDAERERMDRNGNEIDMCGVVKQNKQSFRMQHVMGRKKM